MSRVYNFSAGPAVLPEEVLEEARAQLLDHNGSGMSIMECSHRGKDFSAVHAEAIANTRKLLGLSDDYAVLFLQGGASMQFAMVPMNLLVEGAVADYTNSGAWAAKAIKEARKIGQVNVAADCGKEIPTRVPRLEELQLTDNAAYLHVTSNETISGARWNSYPMVNVPLVADMSSDILSRPLDIEPFGLIYAGAQKNLGPSGMALVIVRKDLAEKAPETLPTMLQYRTHIENDSLYNTPPCWTIYVYMLVTRWIMKQGQDKLYRQNVEKAAWLYERIDRSDFYRGTALVECRSDMNITFRLSDEEQEALFVKEALAAGLSGLKGHRSVGGIRASIYNAFPPEGVKQLIAFMDDFEARHG